MSLAEQEVIHPFVSTMEPLVDAVGLTETASESEIKKLIKVGEVGGISVQYKPHTDEVEEEMCVRVFRYIRNIKTDAPATTKSEPAVEFLVKETGVKSITFRNMELVIGKRQHIRLGELTIDSDSLAFGGEFGLRGSLYPLADWVEGMIKKGKVDNFPFRILPLRK